jgi:hypothetical protein
MGISFFCDGFGGNARPGVYCAARKDDHSSNEKLKGE